MEFTATECGFKNGFGGASNASSAKDYHYVLFGRQTGEQHSEFDGVYFEFDDQINGSVNCVRRVEIQNGVVEFALKDGRKIVVLREMGDARWSSFLRAIRDTFGREIIEQA
jgi:hypothetical protein